MKRERGKSKEELIAGIFLPIIFLYSIFSDELNTINIPNRFDVRFIFKKRRICFLTEIHYFGVVGLNEIRWNQLDSMTNF